MLVPGNRQGAMLVCDQEQPSAAAYLANLKQPMPLGKKLRLLARNAARRLFPRPATCCGHAGEPGCWK